jgi:hypothetical protein
MLPDPHTGRKLEFFRVRAVEDKTGLAFSYFQQRFSSSLKTAGYPPGFANALGKVIDEIADNIVQHSGENTEGFTGIAAYYVQGPSASFAVTDLGAGLLATLRASRRWRELSTAGAALRGVAIHHASSRDEQGEGEGFKQLFKALVDHNSLIRLRTDDAALIVGNSLNQREGGEMASPFLRGVQVSIQCGLRNKRAEEAEMKA